MNRCHELNKKKDSGKFFKLFETINGKNKPSTNSCQISDEGVIATSDQQKANLFAKRLERLHKTRDDATFNAEWKQTITNHVQDQESTFRVDKTKTYSEQETGDEFPIMSQIMKEEIIMHLKRCKNTSAPGIDGLNYFILKKLPTNILQYIAIIFNKAFHIGYFPQAWKHANVKMVPKPGKNTREAKNWRPISLLACLGKLFERVVTSRMSQYLENNSLISKFQSGFRRGRMTTEQLFRLSEDAHSSFKKRGITAALLLDAEAAFDQAWHDAISYKLDKFGLPKRILRLVSSFLSNRKLTVNVGNKHSSTVYMEAGTPQGACLSPLLYLILVNDISNVDSYAKIGQFADDIVLSQIHKRFPAVYVDSRKP